MQRVIAYVVALVVSVVALVVGVKVTITSTDGHLDLDAVLQGPLTRS